MCHIQSVLDIKLSEQEVTNHLIDKLAATRRSLTLKTEGENSTTTSKMHFINIQLQSSCHTDGILVKASELGKVAPK